MPDLPASVSGEATPDPATLQGEVKAQEEAKLAVEKVLKASNIDEVMKSVLNSSTVGPKIAAYHNGRPVTPFAYDGLAMDSGSRVPGTNQRAFLFRARSAERPQGFPICVEETSEGYKVEWEAYIQCRDRTVTTFWNTPAAEPKSLFVVLKRSHYFDNDIKNLEDFDCFTLNSPNPDEDALTAFARKDSSFAKKFSSQIKWDANYFAVAQFAHIQRKNEPDHVEILEIERFNWRSAAK
jgi:hypothetical protein